MFASTGALKAVPSSLTMTRPFLISVTEPPATPRASSPSALMCTLEMVGVEYTLWGSDYPGNPEVSASIDAIGELDIPAEDKKKILGGNIARILG